ncbi:MAG: gliding motility protein GldL [Bacteroidales bacterium]|jgi:gliding motility-associated protein GldL|nr:gliding motility protein GldL [Bacteroidales bacterium]
MGLFDFANKKGFKTFMARLYGWGAALVILGALFKINHFTGATEMLVLGMGTEAIIFFFSAFEKPHIEVNWSAIYPELAPQYGSEAISGMGTSMSKAAAVQQKPINDLNQLFKEAGVDTAIIKEFGDGLKRFSDNANQMANLSSAAAANEGFLGSVKKASANLEALSEAYAKQLKNVADTPFNNKLQITMDELSNKLVSTMGDLSNQVKTSSEFVNTYQQQMKALTNNISALNNVYGNMLSAMSMK